MKRKTAVALALATALLGTTFAGTASAALFGFGSRTNLSGSWQMDVSHSTGPQGGGWGNQGGYGDEGRGNRGGYGDEGWGNRGGDGNEGWGNRGRGDSDDRDFRGPGMGVRGALLPEFVRIDQGRRVVRILDAHNQIVQEIRIDRSRPYGNSDFRTGLVTGQWEGSRLVVERVGPRGNRITQVFTLKHRGRLLVVQTRREGFGSMPAVQFESVYHRA